MRCPKCQKVSKFIGKPGETQKITCPFCGFQGKISFEKIEPVSTKTLVSIEDISKKYKDLKALNNISFEINKGEIFGYIGPNGAGKTTTIKIMVGLLRQTSGQLFISGYSMPEQKEKAHKFIGYMPQNVAFQQWRTVNHALTTFGKLSGVDGSILQNQIDGLLNLLNIIRYKNKKISTLSGGTKQKLGIVQALLHKPSLLILDEPLEGLDPESRFQVKKIMKELRDNGTTIFFSSHILSDVEDVANKICLIDCGEIVKIGTIDEMKSEVQKEHQIEIIFSKKSDKYNEISKIAGITGIFEKSFNKIMVNIEKTGDTDEIIHNIIKTLLKNNCRLRTFNFVSPTLDEVYQYYLRKGGVKQ